MRTTATLNLPWTMSGIVNVRTVGEAAAGAVVGAGAEVAAGAEVGGAAVGAAPPQATSVSEAARARTSDENHFLGQHFVSSYSNHLGRGLSNAFTEFTLLESHPLKRMIRSVNQPIDRTVS